MKGLDLMRDLQQNPYSEAEKRVAAFFFERGLGGGDDPIGFLLASYDYVVGSHKALRLVLRPFVEVAQGNKLHPSPEDWQQAARVNLNDPWPWLLLADAKTAANPWPDPE